MEAAPNYLTIFSPPNSAAMKAVTTRGAVMKASRPPVLSWEKRYWPSCEGSACCPVLAYP